MSTRGGGSWPTPWRVLLKSHDEVELGEEEVRGVLFLGDLSCRNSALYAVRVSVSVHVKKWDVAIKRVKSRC